MLCKINKIFSWLILILWLILIFYFSNQPAVESAQVSGGILDKLLELFNLPLTDFIVRKAAHFSEFAMLSVLSFNVTGRTWKFTVLKRSIISTAFSLLYALSDEIHQIFIVGRACRAFDIFVDSMGIITGLVFCIALLNIYKYIRRKRMNFTNLN